MIAELCNILEKNQDGQHEEGKSGGPRIHPELYDSYRRPGDQPGIVQFLGGHPGFSGSRGSWYIYIYVCVLCARVLHLRTWPLE